MGKKSVWTKEELELLKTCDGKTYGEIVELFPNKKREAIIHKCKVENVNITKKNVRWTKEEDNILIDNCNGKTYKELNLLLPNRTIEAIETRCQILKLTELILGAYENVWYDDEIDLLINYYPVMHIYELEKLFPNRSKRSIQTKARHLRLKKNNSYSLSKKKLDKNSLIYIFKNYKEKLNGNTNKKLTNNKKFMTYLFKYYLRKNNISTEREYILNNYIVGVLLKEAHLKTIVKKNFNGYFDFMCQCFPLYEFKEWEFKYLDVSPNFWDVKENRFQCIDFNLSKLIQSGLLENEVEVLTLPLDTLREYFHSSLIYKYAKTAFHEYLLSKGYEYNEQDFKYMDGYTFDSQEELYVYKYIKNMGVPIAKLTRKDKLFNSDCNEHYIPDFILNSCTYIEYYGLWKSSGNKFHGYDEKVERKNKFYKDNNYNFIAIYPEDLKDNCKSIEDKILSII